MDLWGCKAKVNALNVYLLPRYEITDKGDTWNLLEAGAFIIFSPPKKLVFKILDSHRAKLVFIYCRQIHFHSTSVDTQLRLLFQVGSYLKPIHFFD